MRFNGTTIPTHRDETYDTSEVSRYPASSSGGIEVEALDVIENGTYIAPEGKAYSPVRVDVSGEGSSDFSTAEVKFESTNRTYGVTITRVEDSEYGAGLMGLDNAPVGSGANALTVTVPLYKGAYFLTEECITGYSSDPPPVVTGDLEYISGTGLMITGDGTFTAAG